MKFCSFSLFLILVLSQFVPQGFAQKSTEADSLLQLLTRHKGDDTTRVLLLLEYGRTFYPAALDSFEAINNRAVQLSEKIGYPYGMIRGTNGIAMAKWIKGDLGGAKRNFFTALDLAQQYRNVGMQVMVGDNLGVFYHSFGALDSAEYFYLQAVEADRERKNTRHYPKLLSDLAMNYSSKSDYVRAIQYLAEAKRLNLAAGDKVNQVANCIALGNIYLGIKDFDRAIAAYREGIQLNEAVGRVDFHISFLQNIGLLYVEINPNADSARFYLNSARDAAKKNHQEESYLTSLINLGNLEIKLRKYDNALSCYLMAYESPVFKKKMYERTAVLVNLGLVYQKMGDLKKAEHFTRQGIALARAGGYMTFEKNGLDVLAQNAFRRNDFKTAYLYQIRSDTLQDSIWSETVKGSVAEATFRLELDQAEIENALLVKDNEVKQKTILNQRFLVVGVVVVLLLVVLLMVNVVRSNRKQKELNKALDHKNKELEDLNITKDKFISIIAHDLKSPFNALLGFLTELDENYQDYDEKTKRDIIHRLKKSSYNTFNLLINLLEWTQSQQGKMKSTPKQFMFKAVAEEVLGVLATRYSAKNQTMISEYDETLQIDSDPQIIKSILINLINNAIKFTPLGGRIMVTAKSDGKSLQLSVADSGIGIPQREIGNLFRLDSRFNRKGTEQEPGTGLGLVMVHEYVNLLKGEIQVTSEEGKGSTFTLILPEKKRVPA